MQSIVLGAVGDTDLSDTGPSSRSKGTNGIRLNRGLNKLLCDLVRVNGDLVTDMAIQM